MLKLSACIEMLYAEFPFMERIAAAQATGFDAVEFWGWTNKDIPALQAAGEKAGIPFSVSCVGTLDENIHKAYANGFMLNMDNAELFAKMSIESIAAVKPLGIKTLITTTGNALPRTSKWAQHDSIIACLRAAAPIFEDAGYTLVLEPLNILVNHQGYYLDTSDEGFDIIRAVNSPNVKLLYDVYHQQITEGNLIDHITSNSKLIGHFHIADVPGRHEPGSGEINYANVFKAIRHTGYDAYIGCEYSASEGISSHDSAKLMMGIK